MTGKTNDDHPGWPVCSRDRCTTPVDPRRVSLPEFAGVPFCLRHGPLNSAPRVIIADVSKSNPTVSLDTRALLGEAYSGRVVESNHKDVARYMRLTNQNKAAQDDD